MIRKLDKQDRVFRALGHGTRREILDLLRAAPRTTGEVCAAFPRLDRCTVMQHLGVLERAELVVRAQRRPPALERPQRPADQGNPRPLDRRVRGARGRAAGAAVARPRGSGRGKDEPAPRLSPVREPRSAPPPEKCSGGSRESWRSRAPSPSQVRARPCGAGRARRRPVASPSIPSRSSGCGIDVDVQRAVMPLPLDQAGCRIDVIARLESVVEREAEHVVFDAVDPLAAGGFEPVPALRHFVQAEELERKLDAVPQRRALPWPTRSRPRPAGSTTRPARVRALR